MGRSIWSRYDALRDGASNGGTAVLDSPLDEAPSATFVEPFEALFHRHFKTLHHLLTAHTRPGLALLVCSANRLEASGWYPAQQDTIRPLVLGRHAEAGVFLPHDPRLSLRHLALLLHRTDGTSAPRFRVCDLRTALAFTGEDGRPLQAVESAAPQLLRCASFAILLFPTGAPADPWPEDPDAAWQQVPPRVYVEASSAEPDRWLARQRLEPDSPPPSSGDTLALTFPGPIRPSASTDDDKGPARGEISIRSPRGHARLRLGIPEARQGVLLGRYERCDGGGLPLLDDASLSRVHLLLIELDGGLYAVDTASKNGSWFGSQRIEALRLQTGSMLTLARDVQVEWRPYH